MKQFRCGLPRGQWFLAALFMWFAAAGPVSAAESLRGVALVIGNGDYAHLPALPNPENDARAIEDLLNRLGFETDLSSDRDARRLARDLEDFAEDAEGADVAILYYSGHGIEAGGENFLVPVDADLSALDAAAQKLVPISALLEKLKASVPVTILILDACRDNPFPADAMVRLAANAAPQPIGSAGLGETRGVTKLGSGAQADRGTADFGSVIAFAAEPGRVALDGAPGGNSPYTAAILRHFDAMQGEEFGTVMRMVAEEVYLKTSGRQRPWVNESLRRLLYFGGSVATSTGTDGEILAERRQLLLTIASLPDIERRTVENIARDGAVPMDALYGMLRALGADAPKDPAELDRLLREQSKRIEEMKREQDAIKSTDPEIARLSGLAEQAVSEGALATALSLHEQAKARVREVEKTVEQAEADIAARRREFGDVYAASGRANYMTFNYEQAAADYEQAFRQVEKWDPYWAWAHRGNQAVALRDSGWKKGELDNLHRAAEIAREVVTLADRTERPADWALSQVFLGNVLLSLGQRDDNLGMLREAAAAYEQSLTFYTEENAAAFSAERLDVLHNLAGTLVQIGAQEEGTAGYLAGIASFEELARLVTRADDALFWARTVTAMGNAMNDLARREGNIERFRASAALLEQALEARTGEEPEKRAETLEALAVAYSEIGGLSNDAQMMRKAEPLFAEALAMTDQGREPVEWAALMQSRALNLHMLAKLGDHPAELEQAVGLLREAIATSDTTQLRGDSASSRTALAGVLTDMGRARAETGPLEEAIALFDQALPMIDRDRDVANWADTVSRRADSMRNLADITGDHATYMEALARHDEALAGARDLSGKGAEPLRQRVAWFAISYDRVESRIPAEQNLEMLLAARRLLADNSLPGARAFVDHTLGRALYAQGIAEKDPAVMRRAVEAYRAAIVPEAADERWGTYLVARANLALACIELDRMEAAPELIEEAVSQLDAYLAEEKDEAGWLRNQRRLAESLTKLADGGRHPLYRRAATAWRDLAARTPADAEKADMAWFRDSEASALQNLVAYGAEAGLGLKTAEVLREATDAYAQAAALYGEVDDSESWRRAMENRADLLRNEGAQTRNAETLRGADRVYGELIDTLADPALAEIRRRVLLGRANNLSLLGSTERDTATLDRAIALFAETLGGTGETAAPEEWAQVVTFANTLVQRGVPAREQPFFARAAAIFDTLGDGAGMPPADRAWLRNSQADAWLSHGYPGTDTAILKRALDAYLDAAAVYNETDFPDYWRGIAVAVANARALLGSRTGDVPVLEEAIGEFRHILAQTAREADPQLWAYAANGLSFGQTALARNNGRADLEEGVRMARTARDIYLALPDKEVEAAEAEDSLCGAMTELGAARKDRGMVTEALAICDSAIGVLGKRRIVLPDLMDNRTRAAERLAAMK